MKNKIWVVSIVITTAAAIGFFVYQSLDKSNPVDLSAVSKSVTIRHFDDAFFTSDPENVGATINRLKKEYGPFFDANQDVAFWQKQRLDKGQNQLYADWKNQLKNYDAFDEELDRLFKHVYYYYPDLPEITAFTYISNIDFNYPILLADQFLFIATDMYLGQNHPAYQRDPAYTNYFRQKTFILRDVSENVGLIMAQKNPEENTLLNDMMYWGKMTYLAKALQPETHDTIIAKMSSKHLAFCLSNEQEMWNYFIQNELLFSSADDVKRKFIQPAPFSKFGMPFDAQTPGMVGRWLGFRIVESYMQSNPDVSLPQLMADADTRKIFKLSKYKP